MSLKLGLTLLTAAFLFPSAASGPRAGRLLDTRSFEPNRTYLSFTGVSSVEKDADGDDIIVVTSTSGGVLKLKKEDFDEVKAPWSKAHRLALEAQKVEVHLKTMDGRTKVVHFAAPRP